MCTIRRCPAAKRCSIARVAPAAWSIATAATFGAAPVRSASRCTAFATTTGTDTGTVSEARASSTRLSAATSTTAATSCASNEASAPERSAGTGSSGRVDRSTWYPAVRAARSKPIAVLDGPYRASPVLTSPSARLRPPASARAAARGRYPSSATAAATWSRNCSRTVGSPLMTRETVWCETPARSATSKIVGALRRLPSWAVVVVTWETVPRNGATTKGRETITTS